MPLYYFKCDGPCKQEVRRIISPEQAQAKTLCPKPDCGGTLRRTPKPPTAQVVETLDNGWMTRKVERLADAERIFAERAAKDPLKDD